MQRLARHPRCRYLLSLSTCFSADCRIEQQARSSWRSSLLPPVKKWMMRRLSRPPDSLGCGVRFRQCSRASRPQGGWPFRAKPIRGSPPRPQLCLFNLLDGVLNAPIEAWTRIGWGESVRRAHKQPHLKALLQLRDRLLTPRAGPRRTGLAAEKWRAPTGIEGLPRHGTAFYAGV